MIALAAFVGSFLLGLVAGRAAGARGFLVVPLIPVVAAAASAATQDAVDPILVAVSVVWAVLAAVGVLLGLLRRRRARPAA